MEALTPGSAGDLPPLGELIVDVPFWRTVRQRALLQFQLQPGPLRRAQPLPRHRALRSERLGPAVAPGPELPPHRPFDDPQVVRDLLDRGTAGEPPGGPRPLLGGLSGLDTGRVHATLRWSRRRRWPVPAGSRPMPGTRWRESGSRTRQCHADWPGKPRRRPLYAGRVTVSEPAAGSSAAAVRPAVSPDLWCHGPAPGGMPWPDGLMLLSWSAG